MDKEQIAKQKQDIGEPEPVAYDGLTPEICVNQNALIQEFDISEVIPDE